MNNLSQIRIFLEKFPNAHNAIQVLDTQWSEDQNQIEEVQEDNMEVDSDEDNDSEEQSSNTKFQEMKINILIMFKKYNVACALAR